MGKEEKRTHCFDIFFYFSLNLMALWQVGTMRVSRYATSMVSAEMPSKSGFG